MPNKPAKYYRQQQSKPRSPESSNFQISDLEQEDLEQ